MNYDGLDGTYWGNQVQRVVDLYKKIISGSATTPSRVVPDEDLTIGEGRRLSMAVMFLDICGFSKRPSETPEEQDIMLRVLNLFFSEMVKIAEDYGGTVEKNTGDGLMAYFEDGGGSPPENGGKRAVACGLTMMAANWFLIRPILLASSIPQILFRISIDYGAVTVARLGPPRRFNANVAIGTTANFAAKMLSKAGPGDIVLGDSARECLPLTWQVLYTRLVTAETGWVYSASRAPYALYRYNGRWKDPV